MQVDDNVGVANTMLCKTIHYSKTLCIPVGAITLSFRRALRISTIYQVSHRSFVRN